MKIFLDSSRVEEVQKWTSVIDGITTNPAILLKEGNCNIYELCEEVSPRPASIEACGDFVTDARKYHKEIPNAVIKVPLLNTEGGDNLHIIEKLTGEGIAINCTALMSLSQVILATKAGARYVSLFAGRVEDEGRDSPSMIRDCMYFLDQEDTCTAELIVGSIRTIGNVLDAVRSGADIITIPPPILEKMLRHQYSLKTVQEFEEAHAKLAR